MAQVTILAAATSAATSADIVLADGQTRTVGLFAAGALPGGGFAIMLDTPDADVLVGALTAAQPAVVLSGPGTYRVIRSLQTVAVGVFTES